MLDDLLKTTGNIDKMLNSPQNLDAIESLFSTEGVRDYFLHALTESLSSAAWLPALQSRGYFHPSNNPLPVEDKRQPGSYHVPSWNALGLLVSIAHSNSEKPDKDTTDKIVGIVNDIIASRKPGLPDTQSNYRSDWQMIQILSMLPGDLLTWQHIDFTRIALGSNWGSTLISGEIHGSLFPRLVAIERCDLVLRLLGILLEPRAGQGRDSLMLPDFLDEVLDRYSTCIAQLCGREAVELGMKRMEAVISGVNEYVFTSIAGDFLGGDIPTHGTDTLYSCLLRFARDMLSHSSPEFVRDSVADAMTSNHLIMRRLAVYAIGQHYASLKNCLWESGSNPFFARAWEFPELRSLIEDRRAEFAPEEKLKLLSWVNTADFRTDARVAALVRKEWLYPLLETGSEEVKAAYGQYDAVAPGEITDPRSRMSRGWVSLGDRSPKGADELMKMGDAELADYVTGQKLKDDTPFEPTRRGLGDALERCVKDDPQRFSSNIAAYSILPPYYIYQMLIGFSTAVRGGQAVSWNPLLTFIDDLTEPDTFWAGIGDEPRERLWIVRWSAELINNGFEKQGADLIRDNGDRIETLLLRFEQRTPQDERSGRGDLFTDLINSPKGVTYEALISYSVASFEASGDKKWKKSIQNVFDRRLQDPENRSYEYWTTLGSYLQSLYYLDREWVKSNFDSIFPQSNTEVWEYAFSGYLAWSSVVHEHLYKLAREHADYAKALTHSFSNEHVAERAVQHVCVGYLAGWELLDDASSLIRAVIDRGTHEQLAEMIAYFQGYPDDKPEDFLQKLRKLWSYFTDKLHSRDSESGCQKLLSDIVGWLRLVQSIDSDTEKSLLISLPYLSAGRGRHLFVRDVMTFVEKYPEPVARLYLSLLETGEHFEYLKKEVLAIVEQLYRSGLVQQADTICNLHAERGEFFLKDLYEKNHPESD
jgi:hypothetical protein